FEKSELGRMKKILPLHEMAESFGLVSKSMAPKRGRKSYFTPEGIQTLSASIRKLIRILSNTAVSFYFWLQDERILLKEDKNGLKLV
ncbi:MAG: hypothetical protein II678_02355, partial [Erysipelotrichaceae bacterium]|nr:hypothetical protein [Erysipelotrichaceae bacterium]